MGQQDSGTPPSTANTDGVETTTGPLGQGVANAVGMAIAESHLTAKFNKPGFPVVDHYTYVLVGDGCLQEGIEQEAASLAGTLKLGKLIMLYDKNNITIEGDINVTFSEDGSPSRLRLAGYKMLRTETMLRPLPLPLSRQRRKPKTLHHHLPHSDERLPAKQGKASAHGEPLGAENLAEAKKTLGWDYAPFEIPQDVYDCMAGKRRPRRLRLRRTGRP